ncbi:hypothetical protein CLV63_101131 [Murinocardiopsis flavida]|uniref:DUF5709 domain-containing protein n=1 Tax=Murinocardiopsis flavida TaxID=645275 RepID=A0A2P8DTW1_9ACTN|nr:hypothetical protein [Murinocardiopsis flavida]PSL00657.1 hypothetical protein CLV63_101131 [Murinocardiopsis flavida]
MTENREDPVNQQASDWEAAGLPAQEDSTEDQALPSDEPIGLDDFGTTDTEEEAGEPLDRALAREEPDTPLPQGDADPEATDWPDGDPRSAEQAAIHEVDPPP